MHWIEGLIAMAVGCVPWMIATGAFPTDQKRRADLERSLPIVKNRRLMWGGAIFLWLFGGFILVNGYFGLGLPS